MRVICIDPDAWPKNALPPESRDGKIETGNIYEVIDVDFNEGYIWFELSFDEGWVYWENCFARCSDIDETELIKEREEYESTFQR